MRIITALILFILFMLSWYTFVEYAPSLLQSQLQSIFGAFNQYIAAPSASTYWPYFLIAAIAVVAGYVAHRER